MPGIRTLQRRLSSLIGRRPRKTRLVLHAGMMKTASTSIQHFLRGADLGNAQYCQWHDPNLSNLFVLLFRDDPENFWVFRQRQIDREALLQRRARQQQAVLRQIAQCRSEMFVFSGEVISVAQRQTLETCKSFFEPHFDEIAVFAYIRSPLSFCASMFQQSLKTGGVPAINQVLPNYRRHIGNLDHVFGAGNVHLRAMDGPEKIGNVTADFLQWAGIETHTPVTGRKNVSLCADAVALLYLYRARFGRRLECAEDIASHRALVVALQTLGGKRFALDARALGDQAQAVEDDSAWISERLGQPVSPARAADENSLCFSDMRQIEEHGRAVFRNIAGMEFDDLGTGGAGSLSERVFAERLGL